ncbi:MAG: argininosuccinate lyase, partial [Bacteroidales bacterium]|jgi:argininosuccinate lyase
MPHKKNPDVFELTRAKCNKLQQLPEDIAAIIQNLPSGYFRDYQLLKEIFLPAFDELLDCIKMTAASLERIRVNEHILDDPRYEYIFSVEEVNKRVLAGIPFREAYRQVGLEIEAGRFRADKNIKHTHEGSIGNLCNDKIAGRMEELMGSFPFEHIKKALDSLLKV